MTERAATAGLSGDVLLCWDTPMQNCIVHIPAEVTLCTKQAARYLGLSYRTLEDWRQTGGGPRFLKLGRAVRYRIKELDQFAEERLFANTGEPLAA